MKSPMHARIELADLISRLIEEHGIDRPELASRTSFVDHASLNRYLRGYSRLRVEQLADLLDKLELTKDIERQLILLFLCQHHGQLAVEIIEKHLEAERDETFEL